MAESFFDRVHKQDSHTPDVLSCLANLSNDEVFTPPDVVNDMLDLLPQEIFKSKETTFLDPGCKTGVFLREIAKRLLNNQMPGYQERMASINEYRSLNVPLSASDEAYEAQLQKTVDHIFHNQLFGIAITELTSMLSRRSVYCSTHPHGKYSISMFEDDAGNIRFKRINHTWDSGKCIFCGASKEQWDRGDDMETYAYEFIHTIKPEELFKMKFDVIISNPPYQLNDGGQGTSASPIYHQFVQKAKHLNPRFLSMIIPSRWFAGGKGLDGFRREMLTDKRIRKIVDYENYKDVFPGLGGFAGGACYFLWDRDHPGECEVTNKTSNSAVTATRQLDEFEIFIRSNKAMTILHKVLNAHKGRYLDSVVSSRKPFGLPTNYSPKEEGVPCQFIQRIGLKYASRIDVSDPFNLLNKWKMIAPKAPIAGQTDFTKPVNIYYESNTKIIPPGTCCTESFIVLFAADTLEEVESFKTYLFTKTARFLLLLSVVSQDITRERFRFVPDFGKYEGIYTDEDLTKMWGITDEEWEYIQTRIGGLEESSEE